MVATSQTQLTSVLHVINYAALSRDVLDETKARVASVYEVIGVRTVWVDVERSADQRNDGRLHLTILLLSPDMAKKKISAEGLKAGVLGEAHRPAAGVYLLRAHRDDARCPHVFPDPARRRHRPRSGPSRAGFEYPLPQRHHARAHTNVHTIHLQTFDRRRPALFVRYDETGRHRAVTLRQRPGGACECGATIVDVCRSTQMAFREYHTRPRLQVPFDRHRTALVGELHDDVNNPWPSRGGV